MKHLLTLAVLLALALPGRAAAQTVGQFGYPGPASGYFGSSFAGPGYMGPGATGSSYIGPSGPFSATPRPIFSPYLDLLRGGSPSANYFLGTVPSLQQQQQSVRFIMPEVGAFRQPRLDVDEVLRQLPETGHPVQFLSYGPFFSRLNAGPRSAMLTPYSVNPPTRR
jgi:hypothetical protein